MSATQTSTKREKAVAQPPEFTEEQVALVKQTICRGASGNGCTDAELAIFLAHCRRTRLDPFLGQIVAVWYRSRATGRKEMQVQTTLAGYQVVAERTGKLDGQEGPYWCGEDGLWKDVWLEKTPPAAAKVIVYRKGCSHGFPGIAYWSESKRDTNFWSGRPASQLAKCAKSQALREAFPQDLAGMYTREEMGDEEESPQVEHRAERPAIGHNSNGSSVVAAMEARIERTEALLAEKTTLAAVPVPAKRTASPEQLAELKKLKEASGVVPAAWETTLARRGVKAARDLTPEQCDELIVTIRAKIEERMKASANQMEAQHQSDAANFRANGPAASVPHTGGDGLPAPGAPAF